MLVAGSKDLGLIPGTQSVEGEKQFLQTVLKLSSDVYPDGEPSSLPDRQTDRRQLDRQADRQSVRYRYRLR